MSISFRTVRAIEVLDSRGEPTLQVSLERTNGQVFTAGAPSGASTGSGEAVELRDTDDSRYGGRGVRKAANHVNTEISELLTSGAFDTLADLDHELCRLDGTADKSRLGANAIVGVSMAAAQAFAGAADMPLWRYLSQTGVPPLLPVPHFNVVNGGRHAPNSLDFQEFMIAPVGAPTMADAVRAGYGVYARLRTLIKERGLSTGLGDEGGFAPELAHPEEVLRMIVNAIEAAGYEAGPGGIEIALDPAASEFCTDEIYMVSGESRTAGQMIDWYQSLIEQFPIRSIEDGLDEADDSGWKALTAKLGKRVQLVGDDNLVTNPQRIARAADESLANAALIKVNQVGTVTETLEALRVCRERGFGAMISHRSGETTDTFIADLAVAAGCGQIKSGAPARGERVAKYNRLIEIESANPDMPYGLEVGAL